MSNAKGPRKKLLAHNDMAALMGTGSVGDFDVGDEIAYLQKLREFAEIVSERYCATPSTSDGLIGNDVDAVASILSIGLSSIEQESESLNLRST